MESLTGSTAISRMTRLEALAESQECAITHSKHWSETDNLDGLEPGLVICHTTAQTQSIPDDLGKLFQDQFPSAENLEESLAWGEWKWSGREGPVPQLEVAPGLVRLTAPDLNKREKRANKQADSTVDLVCLDSEREGSDKLIRGWSRSSRAKMIARLSTLDYTPLMGRVEQPAMVTLTYPGLWEEVAPNGAVVKKHLRAFFERFRRAWGESWCGVWKLEFQRRGAPHFHLLMPIPHGVATAGKAGSRQKTPVGDGLKFRAWLSLVWADIVGATGIDRERHELAGTAVDYAEGAKARDPKKAAQYFAKHGAYSAKEYQHDVPKLWRDSEISVGRFWGYRNLKPLVRSVTITAEESIQIARVLRKLGSRSTRWNGVTRKVETIKAVRRVRRPRRTILPGGEVKQAKDEYGELLFDEQDNPIDHIKYRWTTVPVKRMTGTKLGGGYLCVENGARTAETIGRFLEVCLNDAPRNLPVGMRGEMMNRFKEPEVLTV